MDDSALVQIADGLQDLLDHTAGVLLRVHASVQNTVEKLPAGNSVSRNWSWTLVPEALNEKMRNSQLHDEVVVGPALVELLHPHHVLVLDPGGKNETKANRFVGLSPPTSEKCDRRTRKRLQPSEHGDLVLQVQVLLLFLLHTLHGKHLARLLLLHHDHL